MFGYSNKGIKGAILFDGVQVADTHQCVHCSGHFIMRFNSQGKSVNPGGHSYSWCPGCSGPTCGRTDCDSCVPFEAKLEYHEAQTLKVVSRLLTKYPLLQKIHL